MRALLCLFVAASVPVSSAYGAGSSPLTRGEQELVRISKTRLDALSRHDMGTFSRYTADDYYSTDEFGIVQTKGQLIEQMDRKPLTYSHDFDARDYVVHMYGDTAVVFDRITVHEKFGNADIVTEQRRTETYVKRGGSWQAIAVQQTNLPINFREPVAIDAAILNDYGGQYQWRVGDATDRIFVKDGKLWSAFGGPPEEAFPLGADTFFYKDDLGFQTFSRDAQRHVNGYVYTRPDGQKIFATKIK